MSVISTPWQHASTPAADGSTRIARSAFSNSGRTTAIWPSPLRSPSTSSRS
ncbi:hypothetical protein [Streptomyces sp. NBC_01549]|uniref:hypothetical protein n=1 Tax=Streptomyces sp. NBC_01549 TaxID=2975874 RepID=UPI0022523F6E|nr:hypothetical protein [Streptomyces sp. NBC_01549]